MYNYFMKKYWFKAKVYGWGWYPVTWQGWLVTLVFVGAIGGNSYWISENSQFADEMLLYHLLLVIVLTVLLLFICYKTGEKPRWRWGK